MNGPLGNISKLYTKLPVGIQVSEPIDRDSQASRNDAATTTGFTKSFILGKDVSDLKACLDYSYHYARSCENSNFCFPSLTVWPSKVLWEVARFFSAIFIQLLHGSSK